MKNRVYLEIMTFIALMALVYHSAILWMIDRFKGADSYYSHGFLVPFVTAYLIWTKRQELAKVARSSSAWGLVLMVVALVIHLFSVIAEVYFLSGFSLLPLVFGFSLYMYGAQVTRKIVFPLLFLVFMFPLPLVAINTISFNLKMWVTQAAVQTLQWCKIPLYNEGFQIFFPEASLTVGNPCSGLRSLISLLALGSLFAYFFKGGVMKRSALLVFSVPMALISNYVRVILLCLAAFIYGNEAISGWFHDFTGYLVFAIAFGGLWGLAKLLEKGKG